MRDHAYFVYILASRRNGTLYVGVTSDLVRRVQEHREGLVPGFTRKYGVKTLVYWESHGDINQAILREKRIKKWLRRWKLELIETTNPEWQDLWPELTGER
jgi:putative endonuclease